jgi:tetratricopeptide (TPR) repeat protein
MSTAPPRPLQEIIQLMRRGAWAVALHRLDRPAEGQPEPRVLIYRAQCLMALRRKSDAIAAAAAAESIAPADAFVRNAAATVYSYGNDHARALASCDAALALDAGNPQYLYNRAAVRRFVGDLEGAEQDYDRVIAARPGDFEAYKNRSDLRTQSAQRNHIDQLRALLKRPIADWRGEVQLGYALAKEYEDVGAYNESFDVLSQAAAQQRRHLRYDVATDVATVQWIIEAFPHAQMSAARTGNERAVGDAAAGDDDPIFVLGLPRSGSTLVERILTSHSAVGGGAELDCFALALVGAVRRQTRSSWRMPRAWTSRHWGTNICGSPAASSTGRAASSTKCPSTIFTAA